MTISNDLLQEAVEALRRIVEAGTCTQTRRVGDMYAEDGYEDNTTVSMEAKIAATLLPRLEAARAAGDVVVPGEIGFAALRSANVLRQEEWCPEQKPDLSFRGNEMAGEIGEAIEAALDLLILKLERERLGWAGSRVTVDDLASELADIVITADLTALRAGIDLGAAVVVKFNATSSKVGLSTMLAAAPAVGEPETRGG